MEGRRMAVAAACCAALLVLGCAGRKGPLGESAPAPAAPETAAPPAVAAPEAGPGSAAAGASGHGMPGSTMGGRAQADLLWLHRGDPDTARMALAAYLDAARDFHDPALLARLSRAYHLVAEYVEPDSARRDSLFLEGMAAAGRALSQDSAFARVFGETHDDTRAVRGLGLDYLDALYWYAANLERWSATQGPTVRQGNRARLEAYCKRVLELDERFCHGAALGLSGALAAEAPGGDRKDSRRRFEKAIAIEPNYFASRTLYAETYAVEARDKETFARQLDYVLATPPSSLRDAEPENRYEQRKARKLKARLRERFD